MNENDTWNLLTDHLKTIVPPDEFKTWFSRASLSFMSRNLAVVEVPNKFVASWLRETFMSRISESFEKITGLNPSIEFSFPENIEGPCHNPAQDNKNFLQDLDSQKTIESFIEFNFNLLSLYFSLDVIKNKKSQYNPLYIFGERGLGKTHLLNAIGNGIKSQNPYFKVGYTDGGKFKHCIESPRQGGRIEKMRRCLMDLDILLFDNVDSLADKTQSQEEFISIFDFLYETGKQVVVAATSPPGQVKMLLPQCRSRLEWGVLSEIGTPDLESKMSFIEIKADKLSLKIPDDICFFLANNIGDFKDLERLLSRLNVFYSSCNSELDLCTVENLVRVTLENEVTHELIKLIICQYFNINYNDLISNDKQKKNYYPRQIAMYITRQLTNLNYKEIALSFCKRDHTTVINAIKKINKIKHNNEKVNKDLSNLNHILNNNC